MRWVFLVHRYFGIAGALLMTLWCVSGFVMMFVSYPSLPESARLKGLPPLRLEDCCRLNSRFASTRLSGAAMEMLAGRPVLRFTTVDGRKGWTALSGRARTPLLPEDAARDAARLFAGKTGIAKAGLIDHDQWTVSGSFPRPLYRFAFRDPAKTVLYISAADGRVVQRTTRAQRFWNWIGAVPHWLYFTALRHNAAAWTLVMIWTALGGCFLTITGLWIGIRQLSPRARSPYRGLLFWHHVPGLIFGIFALTWVSSGLLSMNPWGVLEGEGAGIERQRLQGPSISAGAVLSAFTAVRGRMPVALAAAPLSGRLYVVATYTDGRRERFDRAGRPHPLTLADIRQAAKSLDSRAATERLTAEDGYYYARPDAAVSLPVYRVTGGDPKRTRYYLDNVSGEILAKADPAARGYRWLFAGLHRLDFTAAMRGSLLWRTAGMGLLLGVTFLCATGFYLGIRRLWRAAVRLRKPGLRRNRPARR